MVDLINGTKEEKTKYYYALGMELGKAVIKKRWYVKNKI